MKFVLIVGFKLLIKLRDAIKSKAYKLSNPYIYIYIHIYIYIYIYGVSQEECARLRESVPYVKLYRYNPKHLCPK